MAIAGVVLIVAAALKMHHLLTEPIISTGFWESWLFFVIQIPLELGLGIWLLCGLFRKAAWIVGVFAFTLFIGVTLHKGITGAASCGCFGRIQVNPWITLFAIDVPFFVLLLIFRPKGEKLLPPPWPNAAHFFGVAIPTFIIIGGIVPVLIFNKPSDKTDEYEVIKPEEWSSTTQTVSQEWPMLKHIDIADSLRSAIVVALLYQHDCQDCEQAIPLYDQMGRDLAGNEDTIRIAFIEIPPYASPQDSLIPHGTPCLTGKLDSSKKWYIATPLVVLLDNGSVVKYWQGEAPNLDQILDTVFAED